MTYTTKTAIISHDMAKWRPGGPRLAQSLDKVITSPDPTSSSFCLAFLHMLMMFLVAVSGWLQQFQTMHEDMISSTSKKRGVSSYAFFY